MYLIWRTHQNFYQISMDELETMIISEKFIFYNREVTFCLSFLHIWCLKLKPGFAKAKNSIKDSKKSFIHLLLTIYNVPGTILLSDSGRKTRTCPHAYAPVTPKLSLMSLILGFWWHFFMKPMTLKQVGLSTGKGKSMHNKKNLFPLTPDF